MSIRVSGRGFAQPSIKPLYDVTLSGTGRFDITGIPPGFSYLMLLLQIRSDVAAVSDDVNVFFNGDTTAANYRRIQHFGDNTPSSSALVGDDAEVMKCTGATATADYYANITCHIFDYANAITKSMIMQQSRRDDATATRVFNNFLHWENTAAINQITIQPDGYAADEFIAASRCIIRLYR